MNTLTKFELYMNDVRELAAGDANMLFVRCLTEIVEEHGGDVAHDELTAIARSLHRSLNKKMQELSSLAAELMRQGRGQATWVVMEDAFAVWKKPFYFPVLAEQIEELTWRSAYVTRALKTARQFS